jgi:autotransporter-associated beta strand protein
VSIGGGGLNKLGAGTLYLSGNNNYTGVATVSGGTLLVAGDASLGAPSAGIGFNGGTLQIQGPVSGTRNVTLGAGGGTLQGGAFAVSVGDVDGTGNLTKVGTGTLTANHLRGGILDVQAGRVVVRPNGGAAGVSVVDGLVLPPGTALDLNDNDLVVEYSGASNFTTIQQLVTTGFRGTIDPAATGIVSTAGQASGGEAILALFDNALVGASEWQSIPISPNATVGKYTYFGDINIDGQVTGDDYTIIDSNLDTDPAVGIEWLSGDANMDGVVTGDDYTIIDSNLGNGVGNPLSPSSLMSLAVPEPAVLSLLSSLVLLRRRRRQR